MPVTSDQFVKRPNETLNGGGEGQSQAIDKPTTTHEEETHHLRRHHKQPEHYTEATPRKAK